MIGRWQRSGRERKRARCKYHATRTMMIGLKGQDVGIDWIISISFLNRRNVIRSIAGL